MVNFGDCNPSNLRSPGAFDASFDARGTIAAGLLSERCGSNGSATGASFSGKVAGGSLARGAVSRGRFGRSDGAAVRAESVKRLELFGVSRGAGGVFKLGLELDLASTGAGAGITDG